MIGRTLFQALLCLGVGLWPAPQWASEVVTPIAEIEAIQNAHLRLTRFDLEIEILGVSEAGPLKARVQCIDAHWCLRRIGFIRVLQTPRWNITIDDGNRRMTVARTVSGTASAPQPADPAVLLAVWEQSGGRVSRGESTVDGQHWTVDSPRGNPKQSEFYTDPITHLLRRVSYRVGQEKASTIDIVYRWLDASSLEAAAFEEITYIMEDGEKVVPAKGYDSYQIIRTDRR